MIHTFSQGLLDAVPFEVQDIYKTFHINITSLLDSFMSVGLLLLWQWCGI